jgi:hypothetical protein
MKQCYVYKLKAKVNVILNHHSRVGKKNNVLHALARALEKKFPMFDKSQIIVELNVFFLFE